ncbi:MULTISPECIES: glycoside hydrolase family 3 N-terminal domain-containing protein [unclassified Rhizobium]|uniref:glycoside hydrolase family 3 N-terminal domain-containing protein n=1 Tax=unclassified Rhizobium TaxID=2613769 RepID=UPI0007157D70|nr:MULTISPECIES: glycoside hydrolase family 3 N-terminal domain-containing protein [unclassified Rhizobium]KQS83073.1 beta-hexosaminidase [Rhizobium sp. Leaf386]KQS89041.1 beta-hexosaminidase [Rhizobium sp. Leaf391]KQT92889.1 beta-hexosaminidase [Rhizobium sp. Leaf453]
MSFSLGEDARAVLLPAFDSLDFADVAEPFLEKGGQSVLIGETRTEYVSRGMSTERLASETPDQFRAFVERLKARRPDLIVAVDQEMGGIQRLQGLVPALPDLAKANVLTDEALADRCFDTARGARELGVSMFLAPIADIIDGRNIWLENRTMGADAQVVARLVSAYVKGVQRAGLTAVTKHFPGFNDLDGDPALIDVSLHTTRDRIMANALPFTAAIAAGTKAIMTGPAPVVALDPDNAASTSATVMTLLRQQFGFTGLIVSDDLDAPATMRGRSLLETAIASLSAGADLLLVAGGPHLEALCNGLVEAVRTGALSAERLSDAANRVRLNAAGLD